MHVRELKCFSLIFPVSIFAPHKIKRKNAFIWHLLRARHCPKFFSSMNLLNSTHQGKYYEQLYFADEKSKTKNGKYFTSCTISTCRSEISTHAMVELLTLIYIHFQPPPNLTDTNRHRTKGAIKRNNWANQIINAHIVYSL